MRIPTDRNLADWIRELIKDNNIIKFYKTDDWLELNEEVKYEHHYECVECLKKGKYTRAECVHHVNKVKDRPDLALSKYYTDIHGNKQKNLVPLCNKCHNKEHPEKFAKFKKKDKFTNEEKW